MATPHRGSSMRTRGLCVCVCVCTCACVCMHVHVHVRVCVWVSVHACMSASACACVYSGYSHYLEDCEWPLLWLHTHKWLNFNHLTHSINPSWWYSKFLNSPRCTCSCGKAALCAQGQQYDTDFILYIYI